jgi:hypothetical protein
VAGVTGLTGGTASGGRATVGGPRPASARAEPVRPGTAYRVDGDVDEAPAVSPPAERRRERS